MQTSTSLRSHVRNALPISTCRTHGTCCQHAGDRGILARTILRWTVGLYPVTSIPRASCALSFLVALYHREQRKCSRTVQAFQIGLGNSSCSHLCVALADGVMLSLHKSSREIFKTLESRNVQSKTGWLAQRYHC
jgi:hypothetical protein